MSWTVSKNDRTWDNITYTSNYYFKTFEQISGGGLGVKTIQPLGHSLLCFLLNRFNRVFWVGKGSKKGIVVFIILTFKNYVSLPRSTYVHMCVQSLNLFFFTIQNVHMEHLMKIVLKIALREITVYYAKESVTAMQKHVIKLMDVQKKVNIIFKWNFFYNIT